MCWSLVFVTEFFWERGQVLCERKLVPKENADQDILENIEYTVGKNVWKWEALLSGKGEHYVLLDFVFLSVLQTPVIYIGLMQFIYRRMLNNSLDARICSAFSCTTRILFVTVVAQRTQDFPTATIPGVSLSLSCFLKY